MIVYVAAHKQQLEIKEIVEAYTICEQVGNDIYGKENWFVDWN